MIIETFTGDTDFEAIRKAERFIRSQGWAVGPSQRGSPRGIIFDNAYIIAKWRNLNTQERDELDAVLVGDGRHGPLTIETF